MPLLPAVFLVLLTLKLCEIIAVSWWVVFAPLLFIPVMFIFAVLFMAWMES